jgi:hypothetical protein
MGWRETDLEDEPQLVTHDHTRAIVWGALAVVLLALVGVIFSLLQ